MKFLQIIFINSTLWVLNALLNGLLSGTWFFLFVPTWNNWWQGCGLVSMATLIFSLPGFFILGIVLLANYTDPGLFRTILKAGLLVSAISTLPLFFLDDFVAGHQLVLPVLTVMATLIAIMLHHAIIRYYFTQKNACHHV